MHVSDEKFFAVWLYRIIYYPVAIRSEYADRTNAEYVLSDQDYNQK